MPQMHAYLFLPFVESNLKIFSIQNRPSIDAKQNKQTQFMMTSCVRTNLKQAFLFNGTPRARLDHFFHLFFKTFSRAPKTIMKKMAALFCILKKKSLPLIKMIAKK